MIDPAVFVNTELDYVINRNHRSNRTARVVRSGSRNRRGRSRNPFVRRAAEKGEVGN